MKSRKQANRGISSFIECSRYRWLTLAWRCRPRQYVRENTAFQRRFVFKLKSLQLHNLLSFDFTAFSHFLCRDGSLVSATYFVGKVKTDGTEKTKKLQANQQKLLRHLAQHRYRYALGYLMKSDGVFHEKGV